LISTDGNPKKPLRQSRLPGGYPLIRKNNIQSLFFLFFTGIDLRIKKLLSAAAAVFSLLSY